MIILYEYTETAFTNNGLGCLNDATSCVVKETLNNEYELEMEYPVNGIHYSDIQLRRIIFAKPNSYDQAQPFRIYSISKPIGGIVTVNAEHISYDMSGLPVRGALENYAWYVNDVFEHIRNNSVYPCPFTFSSDITEEKKSINLSKPRSVKAFLGTDDGLLSLFGGEWEFDRYNAVLHKKRGQNRGVSIEYGKNLTDVTQDEACSEMYTAVYPYYYQEDDGLQKLDDDVIKILDTTYKNVCILDLSSEFDAMPTQDQLREKAQEYINDNKLGEPKVSLKVSFIKNPEVIEALHDVRLGDTVSVKFIKIGVDTTSRCISYEFNVLTEQYNSIELGEPIKTIVDTMTSTNQKLSEEEQRATEAEEKLKTLVNVNSGAIELEVQRATSAEGDLSGRIDITDSNIDLEVQRAKGAEESLGSRITLNEESITAEVTRAQDAENSLGSRITQTAESITAEVTRAKLAEEDLDASLSLKLGKDENDQVVSMINASADQIKLTGNRLIVECNNFELDSSGRVHIIDSLLFDSGDATGIEIIGHDGKHNAILKNVNLDMESVTSADGSFLATKDDIPDIPVTKFSGDSTSGVYNSIYMDGTVIRGSKISYDDLKKQLSDKRLKRDISSITDLEIEDFYMNLIPTRHKYKHGVGIGEDGKYQFGVIAQWTEKDMIDHAIDPDSYSIVQKSKPLVDTNEAQYTAGDDVYRVDYSQFHALHIYMIQKQQYEIESLKLENSQIKGELDILKQRLERMEEKLC